ncbi:MAG: hypothetical protein AAFN92_18835 [Bacteroidota bacterium]
MTNPSNLQPALEVTELEERFELTTVAADAAKGDKTTVIVVK